MTKELDEKIVSMKFDNTNFQKNIASTMDSLTKFNEKLQFKGATKGMQDVTTAANKVNMSSMGKAIDTIQGHFSALEVAGITTIANITNSIVNSGKNMVNKFTLKPIMSGFSEYETKINAIQTIMSNTESKGTKMKEVTATLNELNTYADKTIYNFAEMTRNIGTFTAAGVDLKTSATAIKGIANLAAASGSSAEQASSAMYQLSQALAAGSVKLQDWNSVVNAGMGGQLFQDALKQTAREQGVAVDKMIKKNGSFRESLQEGWISADVLNSTLQKFTTEGAAAYAQSMIKNGKYTDEQAMKIRKQAQSMEDAATKVKTWTQFVSTSEEAVQSGWAQSWELIIGNFNQSKSFFTGLSNVFGKMISDSANARNSLLTDTLDSKWNILKAKLKLAGVDVKDYKQIVMKTAEENGINIEKLIKKYGSLGKVIEHGKIPSKIFTDALMTMTKQGTKAVDETGNLSTKMASFQKVVDDVWKGNYKNGVERVNALTKAGYKYEAVQKLVNATVDGHKLKLADLNKNQITSLALTKNMSDAQLSNIGFTKKQVVALRKLQDQALKTGTPMNDLINSMEKPSGRTLLIQTVHNIIKDIVGPIKAVKKAWDQTFTMSAGGLYDIIESFEKLTKNLIMSKDTSDKLTRTFGGVFSIFKLIADVINAGLNVAFKMLTPTMGKSSKDFLDMTAKTGDTITNFRLLVEKGNLIEKMFTKVGDAASNGVKFVKKWIDVFLKLPIVNKAIEDMNANLEGFKKVGKNIMDGLRKGIEDDSASIFKIMGDVGKDILKAIKKTLGIHSPSKEMFDVGTNVIKGLQNGLKNGFSDIKGASKDIGEIIKNVFANIEWGSVFAAAFTLMSAYVVKNLTDAIKNFSTPVKSFGKMIDGVTEVIGKFGDVLQAAAFNTRMKGIKTLAIAVAILVGTVIALSFIDPKKLKTSVLVVAGMAAFIVALAVVANKLTSNEDSFALGAVASVKMGLMLTALGVSMVLMALTLKLISGIDPKTHVRTLVSFSVLVAGMNAMILFVGAMSSNNANNVAIKNFGKMMIKLGWSMLIMAATLKIIGGMSVDELKKGGICIGAMSGIIVLMMAVTNLTDEKKIAEFGRIMGALGKAFVFMAFATKIMGGMSWEALGKGAAGMAGITLIIVGLLAATRIAGSGSKMLGASKLFATIGLVMISMAAVIRIMGNMDPKKMAVGILALGYIAGVVAGLIAVVSLAGGETPKIALTLMAVGAVIAMMAGVVIAIANLKPDDLKRGMNAIKWFGVIIGLLITTTRFGKDVAKTMMSIGVVIGILSASVVALSLLDPKRLKGAVGAVSILLGMLSFIMASTRVALGAEKALLIMAGLITIITGSLFLLSKIKLDDSIRSVIMIVSILGAIIGAAYLAEGAAPGMLLLSVALAAFGASILLAGLSFGVGTKLFAQGIDILGKAFAKNGDSIVKGVTAIANLLPVVAANLAAAIVVFVKILAEGAHTIAEGMLTIFVEIVKKLAEATPLVLSTIALILVGVMKTLADVIPKLAELGLKMLVGLLTAISNNIQKVTELAIDIVLGFIKGITKKIPAVIDAGFKLIIAFIDGLASALEGNAEPLQKSGSHLIHALLKTIKKILTGSIADFAKCGFKMVKGLLEVFTDKKTQKEVLIVCEKILNFFKVGFEKISDVGSDIMKGLTNGITGGMEKVKKAIGKVGGGALKHLKHILGIKSPSREFAKLGMFTSLGFASGISTFGSAVTKAVSGIGNDSISTMKSAMSNVSNIMNGIDIPNSTNTITPVLDLSEIESGSSKISKMLGNTLSFGVDVATKIADVSSITSRKQSETDTLLTKLGNLIPNNNVSTTNYYTVDGITYDDGSNVSSAIESIIQAANIERRS